MRPSAVLEKHRQRICAIVESHRACNVRVFGSVLSGSDDEASDLDLLVDPVEGMTLFDIGAIRFELRALLGIEVDVLTPMSLASAWRDDVLSTARHL